ncbi:PREDICTED: leucine-rich repeat-containing protein 40-like [Amphimedon queenslandica]|uniref:Uncharacterized protein n=1 Tax=Amphimedon queenslandica TaxID=400682 RepID=A0A1X7TIM7_AMPQE|nr:PREDICTED: leucine-rich repeat-containing protein 40-like [Amphimedon queenslandica]|eukprot:XP_019859354.1 PREDICTED: leucine-rich repeat-containing protein 40-like [Amphimedon queenslandica]
MVNVYNYRGISVIPPKLWRLNIDPPDGSTASFDVDERWWDQVELTRLDLSSNEIKEISEDIENFNSLSALEVQYNELTCLPNNVIKLDKLSKIFASLSYMLGRFESLHYLLFDVLLLIK